MKKRYFIAIAAVMLITAAVFVSIYMSGDRDHLHTAVVTLNGEVIRSIDLDIAPDEIFTVESEHGANTVCIRNGEIFISEASCHDKICIKHGVLRSEFLPIVCLPNRVMIELK